MLPLTENAIRALSAGQSLTDPKLPGFRVRCIASGVHEFEVRYRHRGQRRQQRIGRFGVVTLLEARTKARELLALATLGKDPVAHGTNGTMAELCNRVAHEHYTSDTGWSGEARRLYRGHIKATLGAKLVAEITYADVAALHKLLAPVPFMANRVMSVVSVMLTYAERWGLRPPGSNPVHILQRYKEPARGRYASPEELARIGAYLDAQEPLQPVPVAFTRLMLLTGARPSELYRARWGQIEVVNGSAAVLRIAEGKTGAREVHIPGSGIAALDQLRTAGAARDELIFNFPPKQPRRFWEQMRAELGLTGLWLRDLRRTFATVAMSNGVPVGQVGELLGHRSAQTTKIYAKLMTRQAVEMSERAAAKLGELLQAEAGRPADQAQHDAGAVVDERRARDADILA